MLVDEYDMRWQWLCWWFFSSATCDMDPDAVFRFCLREVLLDTRKSWVSGEEAQIMFSFAQCGVSDSSRLGGVRSERECVCVRGGLKHGCLLCG